MPDLHLKHWPPGLPQEIDLPTYSVARNLIDTAARVPEQVAIRYHGRTLSYGEMADQVERLAGWLQARGVARGDRVLLYMQNAPQYMIAFYGILRADAAVIPVNPMNRHAELQHLALDTGARVAICGSELLHLIQPLVGEGLLDEIIVAAYADMADPEDEIALPESLQGLSDVLAEGPGVTPFRAALAEGHRPGEIMADAEDLAVIP